MKVLVLSGGDSPEREVSLRSGLAVVSAIGSRYEVLEFDPLDGAEELQMKASRADVVLPILHGKHGEDGYVQKLLEDIGVPFLGASSLVSQTTFNKRATHEVLESHGIPMPKFTILNSANLNSDIFSQPFVLKPIEGGSSIDLIISKKIDNDTKKKIESLLEKYGEIIVEEFIEGIEVTVAVLGGKSLPVVAIKPPADKIFDYENKYNGETEEICPVDFDIIAESIQKKCQELAINTHNILGVRHLSRTDMIIKKDGQPILLEINTMPGLTNQSLFPKAALAEGINMEQLVDIFIKLALEG